MPKKIAAFFARIFGELSLRYTPPTWARPKPARPAKAKGPAKTAPAREARAEGQALPRKKPRLLPFLVGGGVLLLAILGLVFGVLLPRSKAVGFSLSTPGLPDPEETRPQPLRLSFDTSVAKMDLAGKEVTSGITLSPALQGKWYWSSGEELDFFPSAPWPIGQDFRLSLDKGLFSDLVRLRQYSASFSTPAFEAKVASSELYVEPTAPDVLRARLALDFTYPVDREAFKKAVKVKGDYTVGFDEAGRSAFIVTAPLAVPEEAYDVSFAVRGGYGPAVGGNAQRHELSAKVRVPGRYDSARIESAETSIIRTESYEYKRVLVFSATMGIRPEVLTKALQVWILPKDRPAGPGHEAEENHQWSPEEVDKAVLAASQEARLETLPIEGSFAKTISYSFDAPSKRSIYVKVAGNLDFTGGYKAKKGFEEVIPLEDIPREVRIMYEGSILSMAGERTVSLYANDMEHVVFEVGRIIPDQVNHFVTQTDGDYSSPSFEAWDFGIENISSIYEETRTLRRLEPGKVQYFSFDFNKYLEREADPRLRYGLFYLKVSEYDPVKKQAIGPSTRRFILVTDLGILVKRNAEVGYDLFVQSVHSGSPVAGATVEVVGKNGLVDLSATTDASGHAFIPRLDSYVREKKAEVFAVKKGGDMSFLPVEGRGRFLNYSRFDTGGLHGSADPGFLDAFLFSDRGIYRPGDEAHIGIIVKAGSWERQLKGLPLEICVEDPRGVELQRRPLVLSASGFEEFSWASLDSAPTGKYEVKVYLARDKEEKRLLGSTSIKVEEFRPDRLAIRARVPEDSGLAWIPLKDLHAEVSLMNLFGTPAAGNTVTARLSLSPASPRLKGFEDYRFQDPFTTEKSFEDGIGSAVTDASGKASFPVDLARFDKATFNLRVSVEGREKEGGRGVSTDTSVTVSPLSSIVGWKADGDLSYVSLASPRRLAFVAVDAASKAVALPGARLKVEESRYVSVLEKGADKLYHYRSVEKLLTVVDRDFPISASGTGLDLPTGQAGDFIVTLLDSSGTKVSSVRYTVAGTGNLARSLDKNAELQVRLDRGDYAPGQKISINVVAPYTGSGLITIERDRVYAWTWFHASTNASVQTITVPEGLDGTAYVNVSFLRAIDSKEIYASPLSYGVAPFSISRERRTNKVELTVPPELPGASTLKLGYRTARPGRIVVFGVDEGILQVARYKSPRPLDHFFRKRALEVDSLQILDLVLPEYSIIRQVSAMGGDDDGLGRAINPFKRKNKPPVVFWSGIMDSGPEQRLYEYKVPDWFNGTIKVFAVVVSDDALGTAEKSCVVRNNFVITPNVPTVLGPGDEFEVGVSVMSDVAPADAKAAAVALPVRLSLEAGPAFELLSPAGVDAALKRGEEGTWFFKLRVKAGSLGEASLRFVASGGAFSSAVAESISLRPPMPYRVSLSSGKLLKGEKEVPLTRKTYPEFRKLSASVSYLPLGLSVGLLDYLEKYPYGCTEQILSKAFPVIALRGLGAGGDFKVGDKESLAAFQVAQRVLAARQAEDGSFGLWSAKSDGPSFITAYAMHFLVEAYEAGLPVDKGLFQSGTEALKALAAGAGEGGTYTDPGSSAYAIYVLTRMGVVTTTNINALLGAKSLPKDWRKGPVGAWLSGAYALMQQGSEATSLLSAAFAGKGRTADWHYSDLSSAAICLYMASRHVPSLQASIAASALDSMASLVAESRYNSLSSSYTILALASYSRATAGMAQDKAGVEAKDAAGAWKALALQGEGILRAEPSYGTTALRFSEKTARPLYWQVVEAGFDTALPAAAERHGLEVIREYTDASGKALARIRLGEEIQVHLRIRTTDRARPRVESVAIVDLFPSGFELAREASADASIGKGSLVPAFVEAREDRLLVFCDVDDKAKDFVYSLKPTVSGSFALPPAYAEAMYDLDTWTLVPAGASLVVEAPGK